MKTPEELTARYEALCHEEWAKVERGAGDRALARLVAEAAEEEREACAATCERIWKEAPNVRPHYIQNRIADGCLESAAAIRARSAPPRKGDA